MVDTASPQRGPSLKCYQILSLINLKPGKKRFKWMGVVRVGRFFAEDRIALGIIITIHNLYLNRSESVPAHTRSIFSQLPHATSAHLMSPGRTTASRFGR